MLSNFMYKMIEGLNGPFISSDTLELLKEDHLLHRPSLADASKKLYKHCALHILKNMDTILDAKYKIDKDKTYKLKSMRFNDGLSFFSEFY